MVATLAAYGYFVTTHPAESMTSPPNILWITTDQQRFDTIGCLGNPLVRTPHIDALASAGVAFTHAFCQSPVCTPSRASYLTGRYPRTTGCRQNGQTIPAGEKLISRLLADQGYECGLAGKQHLSSCSEGKVEIRQNDGYGEFYWSHHPQPDWPENAYTQWLEKRGTSWQALYQGDDSGYVKAGVPAEYHQTTWCADMAIEFVRRKQDRPWMFNFNCFDPHHPFDPPEDYLSRYEPAEMPLPNYLPGELESKPHYQQLDHEWAHNELDYFHVAGMTEADHRQVKAAYYAMIELIDHNVGRMLAALEETGQAENTLVIFMSDHGEMLGDHGLYLKGPHFYEAAVRVPLIVRWPQGYAAGIKSDALVELLDLAPTLLEAVGEEPIPAMQGRSLRSILQGESDAQHHRDSVFCEYYNAWTHPRSYGTMLRTRDTKIAVYHGVDEGELYDLTSDPGEHMNLWNGSEHIALQGEMLKAAFDASVFTMDPLPPRLGDF